MIRITVQELTTKAFAPFGQAILGAKTKPNYQGDGWISLFPAGSAVFPKAEIGWVLTKRPKDEILITEMERHPDPEIIWTVNSPIIQAVVPAGNLSNFKEEPDGEKMQAFIIRPGQVIIMEKGTWHAPAIPLLDKETLYYFIGTDHPREPEREDLAWIPLKDNKVVELLI